MSVFSLMITPHTHRYNIYAKNFKEPKPSEGFTEVKKINFVPRFDSKLEERLFLQFTAD